MKRSEVANSIIAAIAFTLPVIVLKLYARKNKLKSTKMTKSAEKTPETITEKAYQRAIEDLKAKRVRLEDVQESLKNQEKKEHFEVCAGIKRAIDEYQKRH